MKNKRVIALIVTIVSIGIYCVLLIIFNQKFTDNTRYRAAALFTDVDYDAWYEEAVDFVNSHGIMTGVGGGKFKPNNVLNLGQAAVILYRIAGEPQLRRDNYKELIFEYPNNYFSEALEWLIEHGIYIRYDTDRFYPSARVTRQHFALILFRFACAYGFEDPDNELYQTEIDTSEHIGNYAYTAFNWAVKNSIIGVDSKLRPGALITRGEAAVMISRFMQKYKLSGIVTS
ncbi:MAG: S-layer homology domain-containing protein [Lachnospiraceae bacterium]|nr:S-layer homology domain-containing protein [Lachnospiraceae bacterium]